MCAELMESLAFASEEISEKVEGEDLPGNSTGMRSVLGSVAIGAGLPRPCRGFQKKGRRILGMADRKTNRHIGP